MNHHFSHGTRVNESRHTCEWVTSHHTHYKPTDFTHLWMSPVTHVIESCYRIHIRVQPIWRRRRGFRGGTKYVCYGSFTTCEWVMSHHRYYMPMHVTESCTSCILQANGFDADADDSEEVSHGIHIQSKWVMAYIWFRGNESWHTYIRLSERESWHIYTWGMSHTFGDSEERYAVATISRLLKIIGLFCKRAL